MQLAYLLLFVVDLFNLLLSFLCKLLQFFFHTCYFIGSLLVFIILKGFLLCLSYLL